MTFLVPDPAELRAFASRIGSAADTARAQADRLALSVAATGWHGPAARAFAGQAEVAIGALRTAAGRLHDAADTVRRHADRVEDVVHVALRLVQLGAGPLPALLAHPEELLRPLGTELHDVASVAGGVVRGAGSPIGHAVGDALSSVGLG